MGPRRRAPRVQPQARHAGRHDGRHPAEYQGVRTGADGWLRSYAGTNPAEFFAVATEAFFTLPVAMRQDKPALYEVLSDYYRQDPAARVRAALAAEEQHSG